MRCEGSVKPATAQNLGWPVRIDRRIGRYRLIVQACTLVAVVGHGAGGIEEAARRARTAGSRHLRGRVDWGVIGGGVAEAIGPLLRHRDLAAARTTVTRTLRHE